MLTAEFYHLFIAMETFLVSALYFPCWLLNASLLIDCFSASKNIFLLFRASKAIFNLLVPPLQFCRYLCYLLVLRNIHISVLTPTFFLTGGQTSIRYWLFIITVKLLTVIFLMQIVLFNLFSRWKTDTNWSIPPPPFHFYDL